jgi:hypothetical protein
MTTTLPPGPTPPTANQSSKPGVPGWAVLGAVATIAVAITTAGALAFSAPSSKSMPTTSPTYPPSTPTASSTYQPAAGESGWDLAFIATLRKHDDFNKFTDDQLITAAKVICNCFEDGMSFGSTVTVTKGALVLSAPAAGALIGVSTGAYCPGTMT